MGGLLSLFWGCGAGPTALDPLPRAVAIRMLVVEGEPITAYFSVEPNPRGRIDVRLSHSLEDPMTGEAWTLEAAEGDRRRWTMGAPGAPARELSLPVEVLPARLNAESVWMSGGAGVGFRCGLATGTCTPAASAPETRWSHTGPGAGFRVELEDRTLRLHQPHESDDVPAELVASRVLSVLAVDWLFDAPTPEQQERLDRTFRAQASVRAGEGAVVVDGVLDEWEEAEPVVVDAPWQAAVREHWRGPADASFSVAARHQGTKVCFAGRLRDDDLTEADTLTVNLGRTRSVIHLVAGTVLRESRVDARPLPFDADQAPQLVVAAEPFGWHYELCMERPARSMDRRDVAFSAVYSDKDGEDPADELATAPDAGANPAGSILFVH